MSLNQHQALQINLRTNEPFLRLRSHKNVILTPYRRDDTTELCKVLNDPLVYKWILRTKVPFTPQDADAWLNLTRSASDTILSEKSAFAHVEGSDLVSGDPLTAIREVQADGSDVLIGHISVYRWALDKVFTIGPAESGQAPKNAEENLGLNVGDPNIVWTITDYLSPAHHGQGIMSDAIETIIHDWAVPRMGVRKILIGAMVENGASAKVFLKNGFRMWLRVKEFDYSPILDRMRDVDFYVWHMDPRN